MNFHSAIIILALEDERGRHWGTCWPAHRTAAVAKQPLGVLWVLSAEDKAAEESFIIAGFHLDVTDQLAECL